MSLTSSLLTSVSGLQTAQRQIQVTSGNVSNANVEGYSRKTASAITNMSAGQNSGVELSQVTRQVNDYLNSEARRAGTELSALTAKNEFLESITQMFGTLENDSTLSNGLSDLSSAFEALAVDPESATVRADVVEAADELARQFNRFSSETLNLRIEADRQIDLAVDEINTALSRISELNDEISRGLALDEPVGELQDERDRHLGTLSELMDVRTFERSTGEIVVVGRTDDTGTGADDSYSQTLVDSSAVQFDFTRSTGLNATATGDMPTFSSDPTTQLNVSAGGKLGTLIEMRDTTLTDFHEDLDRMSQLVRDTINEVHNQGTFGNAPQTQISGTLDASAKTFTAQGDLILNTVDTTTGDVDTSYSISLAGDTDINDVVASINGTMPANIASVGANGELVLDASVIGPNTQLTVDTNDTQITETTAGEDIVRNASHYFGLNNLFETQGVDPTVIDGTQDNAGAAGAIEVRSDILSDPALLARGKASSTSGDVPVAAGDNQIAQQLAGAFDTEIGVIQTDNIAAVTTTLSGYASDILSVQSNAAARTESDMNFQEELHSELQFRADSESGVNIDEELSNILLFEQAYNASARVISTVQEMFDTLDRMMN